MIIPLLSSFILRGLYPNYTIRSNPLKTLADEAIGGDLDQNNEEQLQKQRSRPRRQQGFKWSIVDRTSYQQQDNEADIDVQQQDNNDNENYIKEEIEDGEKDILQRKSKYKNDHEQNEDDGSNVDNLGERRSD